MFGPVKSMKAFVFGALDFSGRATRAEFWWPVLLLGFALLVCAVSDVWTVFVHGFQELSIMSLTTPWFFLITTLPMLALQNRRLHDSGRSGMYFWVSMIPIVGPILLLAAYIAPSQPAENHWGALRIQSFDPIAGRTAGAAVSGLPSGKDAFSGYARLLERDKYQDPLSIEERREEISDYYRTQILGQSA